MTGMSTRSMRASAVALAAASIMAAGLTPAPVSAEPAPAILGAGSANAVKGSYLVGLKGVAGKGGAVADVAARAQYLAGAYSGRLRQVYDKAARGFAVEMSQQQALRLAADPQVAYVQQDQWYELAGDETQENPPSWGIDRLDHRHPQRNGAYSYDNLASNVDVFVIDTGVRTDHQDFGGRAYSGWDFVNNDSIAEDCHGHGSHVAGTVAGNAHGVAKGVRLFALKVFGCTGGAQASHVAAAIDWAAAFALGSGRPSVINVSIQCGLAAGLVCGNVGWTDAVNGAIALGIPVVHAAGNFNNDACARGLSAMGNAIVVGALDQAAGDTRAGYSNWGTCLDIFAPGSNIVSLGWTSTTATATMSGTSMAAPHVAGAVALIMGRGGPWATATPAAILNELHAMAVNDPVGNAGAGSPDRVLYTAAPTVLGASPISAARNADMRLQLTAVDTDGNLLTRSQEAPNSPSWTGWTTVSGGGVAPYHSVSSEIGHEGRIETVGLVRSNAPAAYQDSTWRGRQAGPNSAGWDSFTKTDGLLVTSALVRGFGPAAQDNRLFEWGANTYGQVYYRRKIVSGGDTWSAWTQFSVHNQSPAAYIRALAAETNAIGLAQVFALDGTGRVWTSWESPGTWNGSAYSWTPWTRVQTNLPAGTKAIAATRLSHNGYVVLVGATSAGGIWYTVATGCCDVFAARASIGTGMGRTVAVETNADGRVEVFTVNAFGQVWRRAQTQPAGVVWQDWALLSTGPPIRR